MADANTLITINCRRCGGAGVIPAFKPVNGGECWDCGGIGKETVRKGSQSGALSIISALYYTANIVLNAAAQGNKAYAEFYMNTMIDDLFLVGTEDARKVLDVLNAGHYYDSESHSDHVCPAAAAANCRTYIIVKGRERLN